MKGRRQDIIEWRTAHRCSTKPDPDPDPQGATSQVEHAGARYYETSPAFAEAPVVQARIGFHPNA